MIDAALSSLADNKCEGMAGFTTIWQLSEEKWKMTRVLSYRHRQIKPSRLGTQ
ncbi:hypothetical protein R6242_21950 [Iodobacter sp. CM08]|uniref:hypothetical protein n=1 Tax=Iodobacter sp. CM08 TaxID=3085902 RepID=UPI002981D5E8|nr:hypothetical protein [Iodobacter sp. CM08]MDW5419240.1 hypothetical protein [Iodobacter sp. CM08]